MCNYHHLELGRGAFLIKSKKKPIIYCPNVTVNVQMSIGFTTTCSLSKTHDPEVVAALKSSTSTSGV